MTIHEVRIDERIERNAVGGPRFKTTIIPVGSGHEQRNREWSLSRGRWNFAYGIVNQETYSTFIVFFNARNGRFFGFLFKDWSDYEVLTATSFGTGDAATVDFQLVKIYSDAGGTYTRKITRPVASTVQVFADAVLQTVGVDYTIEPLGIIRFLTPPASSVDITWTGEFDVPVRFDVDELDLDVIFYDAASVPDLIVLELRE